MPRPSGTKPQLPTIRNSLTLLVGGVIGLTLLYGVSFLLEQQDPSGLSGLFLVPFYIGAFGAILFGGIALVFIGIRKLVKG